MRCTGSVQSATPRQWRCWRHMGKLHRPIQERLVTSKINKMKQTRKLKLIWLVYILLFDIFTPCSHRWQVLCISIAFWTHAMYTAEELCSLNRHDVRSPRSGEKDYFLPRDAMHPRYKYPWACDLSLSVRLSVRHKSGVLSKRLNRAGFWHNMVIASPVLHCVKRKFGYLQK